MSQPFGTRLPAPGLLSPERGTNRAVSNDSSAMANWWSDVQSLFSFATSSPELLDGSCATFELKIEGEPVLDSDSALIRVRVLQQMEATLQDGSVSPREASAPGHKAVLRVPLGVWYSLVQHCETVRAVWTQVAVRDRIVILDATRSPAWLAGNVALRADEAVSLAEIFAGGFAGWTQAAWCVQEAGYPIRTSWMLDIEDEVVAPLQTLLPELQVVQSESELDGAIAGETFPVLLSANFEHDWWLPIWGGILASGCCLQPTVSALVRRRVADGVGFS